MSDDGLVAALARAQAKFPAIVKSHTNPAFKGSQYADVADVLAAVRPVLAAEGIVVSQYTQIDDAGGVTLITSLLYGPDGLDVGISSTFPLHVENLTPQGIGSLMTYIRRYQLCALLGVHPVGDDDDGNLAAAAAPSPQAKPEQMPTVMLPADWKTRPLAQMSFPELRSVAFELGHAFSSGSKSELIRQLQPLRAAMSGEEPFALDGEHKPATDSESRPFEPVVAGAGSSTVRTGVRSSLANDA